MPKKKSSFRQAHIRYAYAMIRRRRRTDAAEHDSALTADSDSVTVDSTTITVDSDLNE